VIFYFDENLPRSICYALNEIEKRDSHNSCVYIPDHFGKQGMKDPDIMEALSEGKGIYVTEDDDLKKITLKYHMSRQKNIGMILFKKPSKNYEYYDIVAAFFKHWLKIRKMATKKDKKNEYPFFIKFTPKSVDLED